MKRVIIKRFGFRLLLSFSALSTGAFIYYMNSGSVETLVSSVFFNAVALSTVYIQELMYATSETNCE